MKIAEDVKTLSILNLEDSPLDTELIHANLAEEGIACEILQVQTRADFIAALGNGDFDIVLADYSLPSFDGLSALKVAQELRPEVPFVLVSGVLGEEAAIEALKEGATDYVLKQRLERLVPSVWRAVREAAERTERERAEQAHNESEERFRATFDQAAVGIGHADMEGRFLRVNQKFCDIVGYAREELLKWRFQDITHPDDLDTELEYFQQLLVGEIGTYSREKRYVRKDGSTIWINITVSLVREPSRDPSYCMAVIEDITERKRAQKEIETRTYQQAAVAEFGMRALAENDLQGVMDEAVALLTRTLEVEYCKVLELLPGGEELLLRAGVGWKEGLIGHATVGAGIDSQAGYTLLSEEPVIVEDLHAESRFSGPPLLHKHGVVSGMSAIIPGRDRPFGVLGAHTTRRRTFTSDDVNFLQAIANVLCTAVERTEAEEELRKVREDERQRLGRELHDSALQNLTYALVEAQLVHRGIAQNSESAQRLERAVEALKRAGQELHGAVHNLRLGEEGDKPFSESLESLVELYRGMTPDLDIGLEVKGEIRSKPLGERGVEMLRILQEALTNVRRHSGARHVLVRLGIDGNVLWAEVLDDGRGYAPEAAPGLGLRGMRERARALGGALKIESEPGKGTKVGFELALKKEPNEPDEEEEEVRVLLVEDHASSREALASVFEQERGFEVVGQAGSLAEARNILNGAAATDVAVVDLDLPDGNGAELIKELHRKDPRAIALVLTASFERAEMARAIEAGAAGVLHKSVGIEEIVKAVRRLRAGESLVSVQEIVELFRFANSQRHQEREARQALAQLTPREKDVLQSLAEGLDNEEIAKRLHISVYTERNHMTSILAKLGVHSRLQALVFVLRYGAVEIG